MKRSLFLVLLFFFNSVRERNKKEDRGRLRITSGFLREAGAALRSSAGVEEELSLDFLGIAVLSEVPKALFSELQMLMTVLGPTNHT